MFIAFLIIWLFKVQPLWTWICHHVLVTVLALIFLA